MAITTRIGKGSELTYTEMDDNLKQIPNGSDSSITDTGTNVGIGTSSPSAKVHIRGTQNSTVFYIDDSSQSGHRQLEFSSSSNGQIWDINSQGDSGGVEANLTLSTKGSERMRIGSSGNVGIGTSNPSAKLDVVGDIEVSGGLYVGGTGSANYLDDYETGTFTPTFINTGGVTYGTQTDGEYVKVGSIVSVTGVITLTALTSNGNQVRISGLPFQSGGNQANYTTASLFPETNITYAYDGVVGLILTNTSDINCYQTNSTTGTSTPNLVYNQLGNNSRIRFQCTYKVD